MKPAGIPDTATMMTIDEVADYLRIHKSTIYRLARDGVLPGCKVGSQWRFKKESIDRWVAAREGSGGRG